MDTVSPELALIDDELGRLARHGLPDEPARLTEAETAESPPSRPRSAPLAAAGVLAVVLIAATLLAGHGGGSDSNSSRPSEVAPALLTQTTAKVLELHWDPVPGAAFYNVILWRDGERELDLWPSNASVRVPRNRLEPGAYQWFVYPMLGEADNRRYGRVVARGHVKI